MKQKCNTIYQLLLFCTIIALAGCEKDLYEETQQNKGIKISEISFSKLMKEQKFSRSFSTVFEQNNDLNAKTAMEEQYGFTIADEPVKMVVTDSVTSYTMLISRENQDPDYFENLVIQTDNQNQTTAVIFKYTPSNMEEYATHDSFTFEGTTSITPINARQDQTTSGLLCHHVLITLCDYGGHTHIAGSNCGTTYTSVQLVCEEDEFPSYDIYDPTLMTGSGGSSGGPSNPSLNPPVDSDTDPIITSPINPTDDIGFGGEQLTTPCADLTSKDSNTEFATKMEDLTTKASTQNFESAYALYQNVADGLTFSPEITGNQTGGEGREASLSVGGTLTQSALNAIGFMHCHLDNDKTFKVFSFTDIIALGQIASASTRPVNEMGIYVTTGSGTFAIKINNKALLKSKLDFMKVSQNDFEAQFSNYVNMTQTIDEQILGLLQFMKTATFLNGMGIDLYQKDIDSNQWKKLSLNSNNTQVIPTDCN